MKKQQQIIVEKQLQNNHQKICQLYITRKKRQCKFPAVKGSKFCASHCSDLQDKIQCPYEKGFFVSAKKFEKHLLNCPKLSNRIKQQNSQWYSKDINKLQKNKKEIQEEQPEKIHENNINLSQINEQIMNEMFKWVVLTYLKQIQQDIQLEWINSQQKQDISNTTNDHKQSQLIVIKAWQNKLISYEYLYVQFGAGKGILSYSVATKIQNQFKKHSYNILLERQSRRNKFDKYFRDNPYFQRYKGDVADFDFSILPKIIAETAIQKCKLKTQRDQIQQKICKLQMVGICKHMCGQALDLSMRGLLKGNAKGCILASCCHHLCRYSTYLNPQYFEKRGLNEQKMHILFRMSSWGTKSYKFQNLSKQIFEKILKKQYKQLQSEQKILIGRMCKRLIDSGRAQYLGGRLYRYCSDQLTPQNYVIISKN